MSEVAHANYKRLKLHTYIHTYKLHILVLDRVDNSRERLNRATQHSKTLNQIVQNVLPNQ
jgi:hypothetical protein